MSKLESLINEAIINPLVNKTISILEREFGKSFGDIMAHGCGVVRISNDGISHIPFSEFNRTQALIDYLNPLWC